MDLSEEEPADEDRYIELDDVAIKLLDGTLTEEERDYFFDLFPNTFDKWIDRS